MTPEIRVDCSDHIKFQVIQRVLEKIRSLASQLPSKDPEFAILDVITIDGIRVHFSDGWGLIRASNTQPALVLRFEASTPDRLTAIQTFLESHLATCRQELGF